MRIGLDFDNTIVKYDELFCKIAIASKNIPEELAINKNAVRDYLRSIDREEYWTHMQGEAYGLHMDFAKIYPGALQFIKSCMKKGNEIFIISHKTKYPYIGPQYDLHKAAMSWINREINSKEILIKTGDIYFEPTKISKIERIRYLKCDVFLDDLPEILLMKEFPYFVKKILFDPENQYKDTDFQKINSWSNLMSAIEL
jgi:hypothetical protein